MTHILKGLWFPIVTAVVLAVAPLTQEGCDSSTMGKIQTAAGPVAEAALDGITCVAQVASNLAGPFDLLGVVGACSKFGVDAAQAYTVIQHMITTQVALVPSPAPGMPGGPNPVLVEHLTKLLASAPASAVHH